MSVAIYLRCGNPKQIAWVKRGRRIHTPNFFAACSHCGYTPASAEEKAKCVLLDDYEYVFPEERKALEDLTHQIRSGQTPKFAEELLAEFTLNFKQGEGVERRSRFRLLRAILVLLVVLAISYYLNFFLIHLTP